ncbi:hypothetical protein HYT54_02890 [Candidatus Woesearchaeota archaeon]|nr:hypothetical protein [Candidatus Woesearchaeota archaeon]
MKEEGKERFIRVYSNLPINVRKEIIVIIDNQPISWDVAYNEVMNNTKLGLRIIEKLIKLDII